MNRRTASRLAWAILIAGVVVFLLAAWLSVKADAESDVLPFLPVVLAFTGVGALLASRRPGNALGWLMLSFAGLSVGGLADAYARYGMIRAPHAAGTAWAAWLFMVSIEVSTIPLAFVFLLFPHGHLPSPRWRVVAWAAIALPTVAGLASAISDVNFSARTNFPTLQDPVQLLSRSIVSPIYGAAQALNLAVLLVAAASLIVRFRSSGAEERQQLKWIAFAAVLAAASFIALANIPNGPEPVLAFIVLIPFIPVAIALAVFKYRLYDIDVVINKTLVYGALAAFVTAVYVGIVVGIGTLVGQREKHDLLLSIAATALVAVGFQPVRERVQRLANRLVYGRRATPYEVLSEFSDRMGSVQAVEDLLPRMARILAEGTGASEAIVWLKVESSMVAEARWPEGPLPEPLAGPDGEVPRIPDATLVLPVRHRDELLGILSLTKAAGERLTPAEQKLSSDLASQAGLVLRNVRLTEELLARLEDLKASRQRLVAAQDEERRRLERNIHDGAQQQLVAMAMKLGLAGRFVEKDPGQAKALLEQLRTEAQEALDDLRDLARGIYPPLLADQGLAAALESQARKSQVPVEIHTDGFSRYPQEAEAAVYFCTLEALQNVSKYAQATSVQVNLREENGNLVFEVTDDGVGFDSAARGYGTGLQGMADRMAALGGELEVQSWPGRGTSVRGILPVGATAQATALVRGA